MTYCIAFSSEGAVDVTARYVRDSKQGLARKRCSEAELLHILEEITALRREKISEADRTRLADERDLERKELRGYVISGLVRGVCKDLSRFWSPGSSKVDPESSKAMEGRLSGSRKCLL